MSSSSSSSKASNFLFGLVWFGALFYFIGFCLLWAYRIRLQSIEEYGTVIHEFDPYFNYRATEYLYEHGWHKFVTWFDYMVWYPLGRPVGTTIYPGMQVTAVFLKNQIIGDNMSLNDICCYMPAWFGAIATFLVGLIAYECSLPQNTGMSVGWVLVDLVKGKYTDDGKVKGDSRNMLFGLSSPSLECGAFAAAIMAIVPAHLMRSVGGGYDNESVAITAMSLTFYLWTRSLRAGDSYSFLYGALAGVAYFYMVAAWGGYVFVLNMIGVHAAFLVGIGRFSTKLYRSYSLFYLIGTALATTVPVVGMTPLKSLEQLGPCAIFFGYQLLQICEIIKRRRNLSRWSIWKLRVTVFFFAGLGAIVLIYFIAPTGYFGPISSRVRGLFVKHTKTGNPLVDSVAEHQPASNKAYFQYLHNLCLIAPVGFLMVAYYFGDAPSFLLVYASAAYFFSNKMVRLILLTAPIASALAGIALGRICAWCVSQLWGFENDSKGASDTKKKKSKKGANGHQFEGREEKKKRGGKRSSNTSNSGFGVSTITESLNKVSNSSEGVIVKRIIAVITIAVGFISGLIFKNYCWQMSQGLTNPTIILKGQLRSGETIYVDDYREAYWWLRDNTPADSRILAWWDYGYQITAIANRTTIADGNTWNHEHIALLGKTLTTDFDEGYDIARHLADYVLVWGGGGGDDLAKSPHLARIANSVYRSHCPNDPTCRAFGFIDRNGTPSPMMRASFLYRLHSHQLREGVEVDPNKFVEVYRSKYGKVRIFQILGVSQESKNWVKNPSNRVCDVEGSWFCPGQYPPALQKVLAKKKDFAQLEDFNRGEADEEYQKQYFENLHNPEKARAKARASEYEKERKKQQNSDGGSESHEDDETAAPKPTQEQIDKIYSKWEDTEETTLMWKIISSNAINDLEYWLRKNPLMAFLRSSDGRGPMWWAFEEKNQDIVKILMKAGVPHTDKDKFGKTPVDLIEGGD